MTVTDSAARSGAGCGLPWGMISTRSLACLCVLLFACGDGGAPLDAGTDARVATDAPAQDAPAQDAPAQDAPADDADVDACADVDCGRGTCDPDGPACVCDDGFHAEGLRCVMDVCEGDGCPTMTVSDWQALFDAHWTETDQADCEARAASGGSEQEHYFLAYCIDGLVSMWRATDDDTYLDTTLGLIDDTIADARARADGFLYWSGPYEGNTYPLWDSYYWRIVATLVRLLDDAPDVRARGDYQAQYEALLAFTEQHIWDKWLDGEWGGSGNFYRSRTHMASHWARIGLELHAVTGEAAYLDVFDRVSHGEMPGRPSNLRNQFAPNPAQPAAYVWSSEWNETPGAGTVQDTSHAGAIVSFVSTAVELGQYWTTDDLDALSETMNTVVWEASLEGGYHRNVDGTTDAGDTPYAVGGGLGGRMHEWFVLGRHRPDIQARMERQYITYPRNVSYFGIEVYGIGAYNARVLGLTD